MGTSGLLPDQRIRRFDELTQICSIKSKKDGVETAISLDISPMI